MKRPLKQYAQAFYQAVQDDGAELRNVGHGFIATLQRDGVLAKANAIIELFRKEWNTREREIDVFITTAREISSTQQQHIAERVASLAKKERATIHATIDPTLIGGVRVRYDDTILDGSMQRALHTLKEKMIQ
ncbi:ATP synthase F1 subunit delta [Candidatus Uhrbacteria bacterium]|nr:ATP synthase F1 subunit delta [Candidatus Uhrbacteria bacterium]